MKAILSLILVSTALLFSSSLFAGCSSCQSYTFTTESSCGGLSCGCADPACRQNNPCLSKESCCAAFGNIGAIDQ